MHADYTGKVGAACCSVALGCCCVKEGTSLNTARETNADFFVVLFGQLCQVKTADMICLWEAQIAAVNGM